MPALITIWRQDWGNKEMPFLLCQLAPYMALSPEPQDTPWAHLREAHLYMTQVFQTPSCCFKSNAIMLFALSLR